MKKILFLASASLLLVSCTAPFSPQKFGISDQKWQTIPLEKQTEIIANNQKITNNYVQKPLKTRGTSCLTITLSDGTVKMPPFAASYPYQPATIKIPEGSCRPMQLITPSKDNGITVDVCYDKKILKLDPSKYNLAKMYGSVSIYHSPLWEQGFTYTMISSSGYAKLTKVTLKVKEQQLAPILCGEPLPNHKK